MGEISQELVGRMVAHFRAVADKYQHVKGGAGNFNNELREVRAIVAELPKPVDPDLIEARKLVADRYNPDTCSDAIIATLQGEDDETVAVQNCLKAIKRGRELERAKNAS